MRIFQIIKKVTLGGAGFIASVIKPGILCLNRLTLIGAEPKLGFLTDASRSAVRIDQIPGVQTSPLGVTGTTSVEVHTPALGVDASLRSFAPDGFPQNPAVQVAQSLHDVAPTSHLQNPAASTALLGATGMANKETLISGVSLGARILEFHVADAPACEIVRVVYDLTRRVGANASANVTETWSNLANCQGIHDGTSATSVGATLASSRKLRGDYADSVGKGDLTITVFRLHFYVSVTGDALGLLSDVTLSYNVGAGEQSLEVIAGNFNNLITPRTFDLFAAGVNTWAKFDALQAFVLHEYSVLSTLVTCSVDAIEVEVIATKTDLP